MDGGGAVGEVGDQRRIATVLSLFRATEDSHISLDVGDSVVVLLQDQTGWCYGFVKNDDIGHVVQGYFPARCVAPAPQPEELHVKETPSRKFSVHVTWTKSLPPMRRSGRTGENRGASGWTPEDLVFGASVTAHGGGIFFDDVRAVTGPSPRIADLPMRVFSLLPQSGAGSLTTSSACDTGVCFQDEERWRFRSERFHSGVERFLHFYRPLPARVARVVLAGTVFGGDGFAEGGMEQDAAGEEDNAAWVVVVKIEEGADYLERFLLNFPSQVEQEEFQQACRAERGELPVSASSSVGFDREPSIGFLSRSSGGLQRTSSLNQAKFDSVGSTDDDVGETDDGALALALGVDDWDAAPPAPSDLSEEEVDEDDPLVIGPQISRANGSDDVPVVWDDQAVWLQLQLAAELSTNEKPKPSNHGYALQQAPWRPAWRIIGGDRFEKFWCHIPSEKKLKLAEIASVGNTDELDGFLSGIEADLALLDTTTHVYSPHSLFILCCPLDGEGNTALHIAAESGHLGMVEYLIGRSQALRAAGPEMELAELVERIVRSLDAGGTPLERSLFRGVPIPVDIDAVSCQGWTALHCAAATGRLRIIKRLCQAGADASLVTLNEASPLHYLARKNIFASSKPGDLSSSSATLDAVAYEDELELELAPSLAELRKLPKGRVFRRFFARFAPAPDEGLPSEVVQLLQRRGNSIDAHNSNGETPLQLACLAGHERNVAMLLRYGANVFNYNYRGESPLDYARHRVRAEQHRKGSIERPSSRGRGRDSEKSPRTKPRDDIVRLLKGMEHYLAGFLDIFPRQLFFEVFAYLPAEQLGRCACVCRLFREIAYDNSLWLPLMPSPPDIGRHITDVPHGQLAAEFRATFGVVSGSFSKHSAFPSDKIDERAWALGVASAEHDYFFKFLVVGHPDCGKTSLVKNIGWDERVGASVMKPSSLKNDFMLKTFGVREAGNDSGFIKHVKVQIWDPALTHFGTFRAGVRPYRNTHGILVCFDVTNRTSFEHTKQWLAEVDRYACQSVNLMLVGCKADLLSGRIVESSEALEMVEELGGPERLSYCETSSKTGQGIDAAVARMVHAVWSRLRGETNTPIRAPAVYVKGEKKCVIQ